MSDINSGIAIIFSNFEGFSVNDCQNGGCLTRAIEKIFEKPKLIENKSLRDLIVTIRELTKIYAGKGNKEYGLSGQMVDFHETLENKVYFRSHAQYGDSFSYWLET